MRPGRLRRPLLTATDAASLSVVLACTAFVVWQVRPSTSSTPCCPALLVVFADVVLPYAVAFKAVAVAGVVALPASA